VTVASFPSAVLVPSVAVLQQGSQSIVFTVTNNVAHAAPITAGIADDTNTQIVSGVNAGDQIVTTNQANLTDGAPVRIATAGQSGAGGGTPAPQGGARPATAATQQPSASPSPSG
jgi:hypothetical protein